MDTLAFGTTAQLTATAKDTAGNVLTGRTFTWSSSDTAIATVTSTGLVTSVRPGSVTITTIADGKSGSASITVIPLVFASVSVGNHTCGVTTDSAAYCWGRGVEGQLGNGSTGTIPIPVPVSGGLNFGSVTAGAGYTCGVTNSGDAYCWGQGNKLGDGATTSGSSTPVPVSGGIAFRSLSARRNHTCGVTTGDAAYCWGTNTSGQLGDGSTAFSNTPVSVSGGLAFKSVSAGREHSCGVTSGGYCWGWNSSGQLGNGTAGNGTGANSSTPILVSGGLTFASVAAGLQHTCGVTTGGAAYCWGDNGAGQLGNGSTTNSSTPVLVAGVLTFESVSAGEFHTCGVTTSGAAYCWGDNGFAQLGNGSTTASSVPVLVSGGLTFESVSAESGTHTCGVTTGPTAYCWGSNFNGQLGDGSMTESTIPVPVFGQS